MTTHHAPWPYPRTTRQVIQVVMVALAALFITMVGTAAQAEHYKNKPLTGDNIRQAASSLGGYASEAAALTGQAADGRSTKNYQAAYLQHLSEQTLQVTEFIRTHRAPGALDQPAQKLTVYGKQLQKDLEDTTYQSDRGLLQQKQHAFQQLQQELQDVEGNI